MSAPAPGDADDPRLGRADLRLVARATEALFRRHGLAVRWHDPDGAEVPIAPELAASPAGLLPALVVAGEAVWREATGHGFALDVARDPDALLGFRLRGIGAGGYAAVMLATIEATSRAARGGTLVAGDLGPIWAEAVRRFPRDGGLAAPAAPAAPAAAARPVRRASAGAAP